MDRSRLRINPVAFVVVLVLCGLLGMSTPVAAQTSPGPKIVPTSLRIRAFGDAVTAGFGFDGSGAVLPITDAPGCRPRWIADGSTTTEGTRCSSNGNNGPGSPAGDVSFSADFGLRNGRSWAAQVASELGAVDFANYAVTGSTLASWLNLPRDESAPAEGAQHDLLERIERDDPDIVLASIGGEAILQQPVGAVRRCATSNVEDEDRTRFLSCVNSLLEDQLVKQRVMAIAFDVLAHTQNAKVLFATYLPAEPRFSALLPWQQNQLAQAINSQIRAAVQGVAESGAAWAPRIDVVEVQSQEDRCPPVVISGPQFLGRTWFIDSDPCGSRAGAIDDSSDRFTPVSLGTVPEYAKQREIASHAVNLIRAHGWVAPPN